VNPAEVEWIKKKIGEAFYEVITAFTEQDSTLKVPNAQIKQLTKSLTEDFVGAVVDAREQEIAQAEATLAGVTKKDWKDYKASRKEALVETRKQLRMYITKDNVEKYPEPHKES
jgi:isocitrate/isopropylmalate dehydrogenase